MQFVVIGLAKVLDFFEFLVLTLQLEPDGNLGCTVAVQLKH